MQEVCVATVRRGFCACENLNRYMGETKEFLTLAEVAQHLRLSELSEWQETDSEHIEAQSFQRCPGCPSCPRKKQVGA
jgi:hypothetical protein